MSSPLLVGAVAYTPNVVTIWEGIREYFDTPETSMDFVLFSNYGRLVDALREGMIDIAWNTNLAYARSVMQTDGHVKALAMRDTDAVFSTVFVAQAGSGRRGPKDIAGCRLALGSADSAHAAILPLHYLAQEGVDVSQLELIRFNSDIGKHGDTGRSELDALEALIAGEADVAAVGITVWNNISGGDLMADAFEEVWRTETYSHCMFTALDSLPEERYTPWVNALLAMDWNKPADRRILELEGLREWVRPQLDGYRGLFAAIDEQGVDSRW